MSWRVAGSLETLRDQINAAWPGRSRASDGTIGDAAHQAQVSDHNPDAAGVVRALDITHDPDHGCDIDALSDALAESRDSRISYLIANDLITGPEYGWQWADYGGSDPHTGHLHLSVVGDSRADDRRPWSIGGDDVALSDSDVERIAKNVYNLVGRGTWEKGYAAVTMDPPYRPTPQAPIPTLAELLAAIKGIKSTPPALSEDQLAGIGASAASRAAEIVGERIKAVEQLAAELKRRMDLLISARVAAAGAESDALAP